MGTCKVQRSDQNAWGNLVPFKITYLKPVPKSKVSDPSEATNRTRTFGLVIQ